MKILIIVVLLALGIYIFDKTCLWLERKGYLYYRHKKATKGMVGTVLQELNAVLLPSHRHVVIAKENKGNMSRIRKNCAKSRRSML